MLRLDRLTLPVRDWKVSRDWYVNVLGLTVEFEIPDRRTVALQDQTDFTIFLEESSAPPNASIALTFQVADVQRTCSEIAHKGAYLLHPPSKLFWGYGAELTDPNGYLVRLWDEKSMKELGS